MRPSSARFLVALLALLAAPAFLPGLGAQERRLSLEEASGRAGRISLRPVLESWSWAPGGEVLQKGRGRTAEFYDPRSLEPVPAPKRPPRQGGGSRDPRAAVRALAPADGEGPVELPELSPDGQWLAFVRGNDLFVARAGEAEARAITENGGPDRLNGKLDWVYQEEIYGRYNFKGFWWSPDSRYLAFLSLDEEPVHEFTVVDFIEDDHYRVKPEVTNYPKAGDPNPVVSLGIAEAATGRVKWVDLSAYEGQEPLLVRVDWTPDSSKCLFMVQNRIQNQCDLNAADPRSGRWKTWIHEENDTWVERPDPPRWLADGTFLWLSHRTDHNHLYHYRPGGRLIRAVTSGDWSVRSVVAVDEESGRIWFEATEGGAVNRNHYRVDLDGSHFLRLTQGPGVHSVRYNRDRSLFLDEVSSLEDPGRVRLCDGETGEILRELAVADLPAAREWALGSWTLHEVPARDGFPLDVAVLLPPDFDPQRPHPVWLPTYSGPNAPSVTNRWNASAWYQFLAQQGIVVLQVNVRSASGKGHYAAEQCYRRLGLQELADLEDAVDWLAARPGIDGERIGITGYSYGGFMTALALCKSDRFRLGIAGGGVYDWHLYDTIYTERYMATPELNPEGYAATSVEKAASGLSGRLLLHHGVMDDNVHLQNAIRFLYALQKAGKDFDLMLYPQTRHGVSDPDQRWHLRRLEWRLIQEELLGGGA